MGENDSCLKKEAGVRLITFAKLVVTTMDSGLCNSRVTLLGNSFYAVSCSQSTKPRIYNVEGFGKECERRDLMRRN